jgi:hypothetical protein
VLAGVLCLWTKRMCTWQNEHFGQVLLNNKMCLLLLHLQCLLALPCLVSDLSSPSLKALDLPGSSVTGALQACVADQQQAAGSR